jgi:hypothetical protein
VAEERALRKRPSHRAGSPAHAEGAVPAPWIGTAAALCEESLLEPPGAAARPPLEERYRGRIVFYKRALCELTRPLSGVVIEASGCGTIPARLLRCRWLR